MSAIFRLQLSTLAFAATLCAQSVTTPVFWPDKNGPTFDGVVPAADAAKLPLTWNSETGENIVWKTDLEDEGHSSPVIGGDMIWFTAATTDGHKQFLYGIDRQTGKIIHHKVIFENQAPEELGNPLNNYAAPSPVLETDALYVHFGTYGTARINPATGNKVWERRDINVRHFRGPGSSPILHGDLLILTFDGIDQQFVTALNKKTGETVWKTNRTTDYGDLDAEGHPTRDGDMRKAYHTPSVFNLGGVETLVSVGSRAAFGYAVDSGKELWTIRHGGFNAAIRPLVAARGGRHEFAPVPAAFDLQLQCDGFKALLQVGNSESHGTRAGLAANFQLPVCGIDIFRRHAVVANKHVAIGRDVVVQ